jgi:hypothetical protein
VFSGNKSTNKSKGKPEQKYDAASEQFFELVNVFKEASKNFILTFSTKLRQIGRFLCQKGFGNFLHGVLLDFLAYGFAHSVNNILSYLNITNLPVCECTECSDLMVQALTKNIQLVTQPLRSNTPYACHLIQKNVHTKTSFLKISALRCFLMTV